MSLHLVILASEGDRPFKIPLLIVGAFIVLYGVLVGTQRVWVHLASRKGSCQRV
jgi:hypothetical protein